MSDAANLVCKSRDEASHAGEGIGARRLDPNEEPLRFVGRRCFPLPPAEPASKPWPRAFVLLPLLGAIAAGIGACGFHPIKAARSGDSPVVDKLSAVKIELIENRIGQELRNDLLDRLNPEGQPTAPGYRLAIKLHENLIEIGISVQGTASRADLDMSGEVALTAAPSGETLFTDTFSANNSYGIDPNSYATLASHQSAEKRLLQEIADEITLKLSVYFRREAEQQK
jgi:LPS-assembly lipoprotein